MRRHFRGRAKRAGSRRHVDIVFVRILRKWRQNTDDGVRLVIHAEDFSDNRGIAPETAQPEFVAKKKDGGSAGLLIVGRKIASEQWCGAEDVEKVPRDYAGFH